MPEEKNSDFIKYLGWISGKEKQKYLQESDIFVLPSYFEGQSIAILEAMANYCAIAASDTGGIPQMIQQEETGLLFEPRDEKSLRGVKILLTEDNDLNAEIATELLQEEGCTVDRAKDGVECVDMLEKAANGTYQVILMDIQMPVMNGYDAAKKIRRMEDSPKADIPIIAMTANAFSEDKQAALDAGMNDHVAKPINMNVLVPTIQKYL